MLSDICRYVPRERRSRAPRRNWLRALQLSFYSAGAGLTALYITAQAAGCLGQHADVAQFSRSQAAAYQLLPDVQSTPDTKLWSAQRVRDFISARGQLIDEPLAILRVPSLRLTVPIYPSASEPHLNRGVGVIAGMAPPDRGGNLGLAGHRDGFFRVLKDISAGALIQVQTRARVHHYRVASIEIVEVNDRRLLAETDDPTITLVTCYPFYYVGNAPQRYIVRGAYVWPSSNSASNI